MSKHTPGPWKMERGGGHAGPRIVGSESIHVAGEQRDLLGHSSAVRSAKVCELEGSMDLPGPAANARLIAAAPDIFELLQATLKAWRSTGDSSEEFEVAMGMIMPAINNKIAEVTE